MTAENRFEQAYKKVFTADNKVKACGREECMRLIELATEIDSTVTYGYIETGCMEAENLIKLHEKIVKGKEDKNV